MTTLSQQLDDTLAHNDTTEGLARQWQPLVQQATDLLPAALHDALRGEMIGHPLHPALVHLPLGGWMAAAALDHWPGGNEDRQRAADLALLLSTVGAVPAVAAGWTDWAELRGRARRTGFVHGVFEESAFLLNVASLLARRKGKRGLGQLLSGIGLGAALVGGALGGELVYGQGVGVKR